MTNTLGKQCVSSTGIAIGVLRRCIRCAPHRLPAPAAQMQISLHPSIEGIDNVGWTLRMLATSCALCMTSFSQSSTSSPVKVRAMVESPRILSRKCPVQTCAFMNSSSRLYKRRVVRGTASIHISGFSRILPPCPMHARLDWPRREIAHP